MQAFEEIHKYLSLILSDKVSSLLKLNFDLKDIECKVEEYQMFTATAPKFCYIALFRFVNRGILLFVDPKIIYILSNRMLGGKGIVEVRPKPVITMSEDFLGKKVVQWFYDFYRESKLDVTFLRIENDVNLIHFFYPDEKILSMQMNCRINGKPCGTISACYPQIIMDKKESSWGV